MSTVTCAKCDSPAVTQQISINVWTEPHWILTGSPGRPTGPLPPESPRYPIGPCMNTKRGYSKSITLYFMESNVNRFSCVTRFHSTHIFHENEFCENGKIDNRVAVATVVAIKNKRVATHETFSAQKMRSIKIQTTIQTTKKKSLMRFLLRAAYGGLYVFMSLVELVCLQPHYRHEASIIYYAYMCAPDTIDGDSLLNLMNFIANYEFCSCLHRA